MHLSSLLSPVLRLRASAGLPFRAWSSLREFFAYHGVWAIGVRLLRRLTIRDKTLLILGLTALPLVPMGGYLLSSQSETVSDAQRLDSGGRVVAALHGAINQLPDSALRAMTTQIPQRHVALVAYTTTDDGLPHLLAEARYVVEDEGEAEFALAVADAWQGQGLGRALVQRLAAHARAEGVPLLHGAVVPGKKLALTMSCDHRVIDGALGAEWLKALRSLLESPLRMLI